MQPRLPARSRPTQTSPSAEFPGQVLRSIEADAQEILDAAGGPGLVGFRPGLRLSLPLRHCSRLVLGHKFVNPSRVPVVHGRVVDERELLAVAVGTQVGRSFQRQLLPACQVEGDDLGMRVDFQ
jgi:hypothetical protein